MTTALMTGRILQFDHGRGYGFVAADDDGDDVFLHTSVFDGDPDDLVSGAKVSFKMMAGDRGRKAFGARLIEEPDDDPLPARLVPSPRPPQVSAAAYPAAAPLSSPAPVEPARVPADPQAGTAAARNPGDRLAPDDEGTCDVLSPLEFRQEVTELLLSNVPSLNGQQILEIRNCVLESAGKHGWVDL